MNIHIRPMMLALALSLGTGVAHIAQADAAIDTGTAATQALPGDSLYHLQAALTDQNGRSLQWRDLQGRPQLVSMFYGNCHLMCPLILENAKSVQKQLPQALRDELGVAMVTLDPARDTPAAMTEVAQRHRVPEAWRFLIPAPDDVRALASVLDIRYRFREDGSINHTSVLVLLDAQGRVLARSEVVAASADPAFVQQVRNAVATR